jgi:hypothetical protein
MKINVMGIKDKVSNITDLDKQYMMDKGSKSH